MATALKQNEQLNELLKCSICVNVFTDPRMLPCLHTFCFKCISKWCTEKVQTVIKFCPRCSEKFVIPYLGIDGLKKNRYIADLSMREIEQKPKELCEVCVCKSMADMLVSVDELQSDDVELRNEARSSYCSRHKDEEIKLYCLKDEVAVCMKCCDLDHRSHYCEEVKRVADELCDMIPVKLQAAMNKVDKSLEWLESRKLNLIDQEKDTETEICKEAESRIQIIKNHKQKLITELHEFKTNHEQEIETVYQEFAKTRSLLAGLRDYCEKMFEKRSDVDICREESSLCKSTEELINIKISEDALKRLLATNVIFSSSRMTLDDTRIILGQVMTDKSGVSRDTLMSQTSSTVPDDPQLLVTLTNPPTSSNGRRPHHVTGVALLDKYLYVVYDEHNKVQVFDCEDRFKKINDIEIETMKSPFSIVASSVTSQLFISEYWSRAVWRIDLATGIKDVVIKLDRIASLSLAENRLLVTSPNSLVIYDIHSGQRLKNIPLPEDMTKMRHALEFKRGSFFVSHDQSEKNIKFNVVSEIDSEGRVIRVFSKKEQLDCVHLALDSVGRLLVVDRKNGCVVVLDRYLKFKRVVLNCGTPVTMNYDVNNNRLAVGFNNGHVKVLECNDH